MSSTGLIARAEWRRSIPSLLLVALLAAVGGGLVMATTAGARRADTAFARFLAATGTGNIEVNVADSIDPSRGVELLALVPELAAIPGVESIRSVSFVALSPDVEGVEVDPFAGLIRQLVGPDLPESLIVRGRAANPNQPDEIVLNETAAELLGLSPGDDVTLRTLAPDQFDSWLGEGTEPPRGPTPLAHVVGIARSAQDISDAPGPLTLITPAFLDAYGESVLRCDCLLTLRADPQRIADVKSAVEAIVQPQGFVASQVDDSLSRRIDNAIELETNALRLAAVVGAIASVLVLVQVLTRHVTSAASSLTALPAIGATRRQRVLPWSVILAPFAALGAIGAVLIALALSPHLPRGLAAAAEPYPGVRVDAAVFLAGFVAVVTAVVACGLGVALLSDRRRHVAVTAAPARGRWYSSLSPQGQLGLRMASGSGVRGGRAGAVMTIIAGTCAIASVVSVALLHRSIDTAVATPAAFGADWDYELNAQPDDPDAVIGAAVTDDGVEAMGLLYGPTLGETVARTAGGSTDVNIIAIDNLKGSIGPLLSRGRMPASDEEVVVGPRLAAALGVEPGDALMVWRGQSEPEARFVVTGIGRWSDGDENDRVFFTTLPGLEKAMPADSGTSVQGGLVRLAEGAKPSTLRLLADLGFVPTVAPSNIENLQELGEVPSLVAAAMVLLGVGGLAHALIVGRRRGRQELAIAAALGLTRRQVARASTWQAAALAVAIIVVGVPVGVVVGRALWMRMASGVSATPIVVMPWLVLAFTVAAAAAVAVVLAQVTGRRGAQANATAALRGE